MPLIQLIYMSTMGTSNPKVLPSIVDSSIKNNMRRGVTGMLLYFEGNVIQVLEGDKDQVLETFRVVQADERHHSIYVISEEEIADRQFSIWSMGFKQLAQADLEKIPPSANVFKLHQDEISLRARAGDALNLLKLFAKGLMAAA